MKSICSFFLLFIGIISPEIFAQGYDFSKAIKIDRIAGNIYLADADSCGNLFVFGYLGGPLDSMVFDTAVQGGVLKGAAHGQLFIAKYDHDLNFQWVKSLEGGSNQGRVKRIYHHKIDNAGNIYIAGDFRGDIDFDPGPNTYRLHSCSPGFHSGYVAKYNPKGELVFAKVISLANQCTYPVKVSSLEVNNRGEVFFTSSGTDLRLLPDSVLFSGVQNNLLVRLDSLGNLITHQSYGIDSTNTGWAEFLRMSISNSGHLILSGRLNKSVDFDPDTNNSAILSAVGYSDGFLLKLRPDGSFVSVKHFEGTGTSTLVWTHLHKHNSKGDITLKGYFRGGVDFDPDTSTYILDEVVHSPEFIMTLDSAHNLKYVKKVEGYNSHNMDIVDIDYDDLDQLHISGTTRDTSILNPAVIIDSVLPTNKKAFSAVMDANGQFISVEEFGDSLYERQACLVFSKNSRFSIGNFTGSLDFDPGPGTFSMSTDSIFGSNYIIKSTKGVVNLVENQRVNEQIIIYPNPTNGQLKIQLGEIAVGQVLRIYDTKGQLVFQKPVLASQTSINLDGIPKGLYVLQYGQYSKKLLISD